MGPSGLADVPSGCVVWVRMREDPGRNRVHLGYWFYGNDPGKPLDGLTEFRRVKHTRANAAGDKALRANTFRVNRGLFQRLKGVEELADKLFGPPAS